MTECEDCEERDARIAELESKVKKLRDALIKVNNQEFKYDETGIAENQHTIEQALKETGDAE